MATARYRLQDRLWVGLSRARLGLGLHPEAGNVNVKT